MASPVSLSFTDPDPVISTAKLGTTTILTSALTSPTVSQVIIISSVASVIDTARGPVDGKAFGPADWNDNSPAEVARLGNQTPGVDIYCASKVAAEKAFWAFRDEYNPNWNMTAINPALVSGPPLLLPEDPEKISETVKPVWDILSGRPIPPPLVSGHMIDIRDVARMHVYAANHPEATGGKRIILCSAFAPEQAIADILHDTYPQRNGQMQKGKPGQGYLPGYGSDPAGKIPRFDTSIAEDLLFGDRGGWISYDNTVRDSAKAFEKYLQGLGFLAKGRGHAGDLGLLP